MICTGRKHCFSILYGLQESTPLKRLVLIKWQEQCFVDFKIGSAPLMADFGLIKSVALKEVPQFSH
jgi:hypothetical protein